MTTSHNIKILDQDIEESFVRSPGPGGQNVNKVASCVVLKHRPTGIQVKCHQERTQAQNRQKAKELLITKVSAYFQRRAFLKKQAEAKQKRQNRKRPKFLKEEILEHKRRQSEKKKTRQKINLRKLDSFM